MMIYSVFRYNVGDILQLKDETQLIMQYRKFVEKHRDIEIARMFEWLIRLSKDQLLGLRLEYIPDTTNRKCPIICVKIKSRNAYNEDLIWRNDRYDSSQYGWYRT